MDNRDALNRRIAEHYRQFREARRREKPEGEGPGVMWWVVLVIVAAVLVAGLVMLPTERTR